MHDKKTVNFASPIEVTDDVPGPDTFGMCTPFAGPISKDGSPHVSKRDLHDSTPRYVGPPRCRHRVHRSTGLDDRGVIALLCKAAQRHALQRTYESEHGTKLRNNGASRRPGVTPSTLNAGRFYNC